MDTQRDEEFEKAYHEISKPIIARPYPRNEKGEYFYKEIHEAYLMWRAAKTQAVPYESCSRKSHEIIINETKNELIDKYDIAKEDEYLLESLVFRGVCMGKAQAIPEGFVLVPKLLSDQLADELASDAFNNIQNLFDYEHRGSTAIEREEFRLRWCRNKAKEYQHHYKTLIEAQDQAHD